MVKDKSALLLHQLGQELKRGRACIMRAPSSSLEHLQGMPACARSLCSGSKWVVSDEPRIIRHT